MDGSAIQEPVRESEARRQALKEEVRQLRNQAKNQYQNGQRLEAAQSMKDAVGKGYVESKLYR